MDRIHVTIASDANYFVALRTAVFSILHTNSEERFTFHILKNKIDSSALESFATEVSSISEKSEVKYYDVDTSHFHGFDTLKGSTMQYARLLLPSIIEIPQIIYLDCDVLVTGKLRGLWETDIDNALAAVTQSIYLPKVAGDWPLDTPAPDAKYFGSGVMLINLDGWRAADVQNTVLSLIEANPSRYKFWDQTALNVALLDRVVFVDGKYNFDAQGFVLGESFPVVIHYMSRYRNPWESCAINSSSAVWVRFYTSQVDGIWDQWKYYKGKLCYWRSVKDRLVVSSRIIYNLNNAFLSCKYALSGDLGKEKIEARRKSYKRGLEEGIKLPSIREVDRYLEEIEHKS